MNDPTNEHTETNRYHEPAGATAEGQDLERSQTSDCRGLLIFSQWNVAVTPPPMKVDTSSMPGHYGKGSKSLEFIVIVNKTQNEKN